MKIATITEVKNKLSSFIDRVRSGETILIVDRGRPVARLEPAVAIDEDADARLARLQRAGIVRVARRRGRPSLLDQPPPRPRPGTSIVDELIAERRTGR
jgi:prevent-host-death family protein